MGADDGNRTRMTSLEGWGSTIELHPRGLLAQAGRHPCSVPARAGFPHAWPRPPQAKSQGLSRTVACFTPTVRLRATVATPPPLDDTPEHIGSARRPTITAAISESALSV
jgi:hypothetical protein